MRKKWFAFGCLTSIVLLVALFYAMGASLNRLAKKKVVKLDPNTYLHLKLTGNIKEYNELKDDYFFAKLSETPLAVHDLITKINFAVHDPNVRGILIEPYFMATGFANMNEIRRALSKFRQAGKSVYTYLEFSGNSDYFVSCNADRIFMNPSASAGLLLTGIGSDVLFFKEMFDKIGVEVNVIHAGDYKGAGENFSRTGFSAPVKKNLEKLIDELYAKMLQSIAESRNISVQDIQDVYEKRSDVIINQNRALEYKLVDELAYRDDMLSKLNIKKNQLLDINKYKIKEHNVIANNQIAVVYAQGEIMKGSSTDTERITSTKLNKILTDLEKDSNVKAIVLRVNSPGGSALESEIILHKMNQVREKKPIVISMGNVAASGGYYIACNSDYIYADDFTITGSIGVVGMLPNAENLSAKIGITTDKISRGKYTSLVTFWKRPSQDNIASIKAMIENTYVEFKTRVANGRNISINDVERIAQGQIWSSSDALSNKLIDEIGSAHDAVLKASVLANMTSYTLQYYPKQKTFMEYFLEENFDINLLTKTFFAHSQLSPLALDSLHEYLKSLLYDPIQTIMPFPEIVE
jgi:protease-4